MKFGCCQRNVLSAKSTNLVVLSQAIHLFLDTMVVISLEIVQNIMRWYPIILGNQNFSEHTMDQKRGGVLNVVDHSLLRLTAQAHFAIKVVRETGWIVVLDRIIQL